MADGLRELFLGAAMTALFGDDVSSKPPAEKKPAHEKISSKTFRIDKDKRYTCTAKDIPWSSKSMDLKYKCITKRLSNLKEELERSGRRDDVYTIESIMRQIEKYNDEMYFNLKASAKEDYDKLSGYYNDYNLEVY